MSKKYIRPIVLCLFHRGDRILVAQTYDSVAQDYFCRPLGGGIDFGEYSQDAIAREIQEELGAEIKNLEFLAILENVFVYEGNPKHEVVFVYDAEFSDPAMYDKAEIHGYDNTGAFVAQWLSVAEIAAKQVRLVPEGLAKLLLSKA